MCSGSESVRLQARGTLESPIALLVSATESDGPVREPLACWTSSPPAAFPAASQSTDRTASRPGRGSSPSLRTTPAALCRRLMVMAAVRRCFVASLRGLMAHPLANATKPSLNIHAIMLLYQAHPVNPPAWQALPAGKRCGRPVWHRQPPWVSCAVGLTCRHHARGVYTTYLLATLAQQQTEGKECGCVANCQLGARA
jgi:hypothetical protein